MFVLYYLEQGYDGGDCKIIAISKSEKKLKSKIKELCAPYKEFLKTAEEFAQNGREMVEAFCKRQKASMKKSGSAAFLKNNYPLFINHNKEFLRKYIDLNTLTEPLPVIEVMKQDWDYKVKAYVENYFVIQKVEEI